jgi:PAS domain S-box-containing protein
MGRSSRKVRQAKTPHPVLVGGVRSRFSSGTQDACLTAVERAWVIESPRLSVIAAVGIDVFFLKPFGSVSLAPRDLLTLGLFVVVGVLMTGLNVARLRALQSAQERQHWFQTTLGSIGDAVIATDRSGRIQFLNKVAEDLTGWSVAAAVGSPIRNVFQIINEQTRASVDNPVDRVIREGRVVGLANHTALISRTGREFIIDDSGAPIRDDRGELLGVVMVFRDSTPRWREQQRKVMLGEASAALAASFDYNATLNRVAKLAVPQFADWCAVHLVDEDATVRR